MAGRSSATKTRHTIGRCRRRTDAGQALADHGIGVPVSASQRRLVRLVLHTPGVGLQLACGKLPATVEPRLNRS